MSDVLKTLQTNMNKELELVSSEITRLQQALEQLGVRQQQLKGACYALQLAQGELDKPATAQDAAPTAPEATEAIAAEVVPEGASDGSAQST